MFLEKPWLALMGGTFSELEVECEIDGFGIRWYRYDSDSFFMIL